MTPEMHSLSVSSNGSTWVKPVKTVLDAKVFETFSILERIDVGETRKFCPRLSKGRWYFQYPRTDRRG